jgi:hypothetical protein
MKIFSKISVCHAIFLFSVCIVGCGPQASTSTPGTQSTGMYKPPKDPMDVFKGVTITYKKDLKSKLSDGYQWLVDSVVSEGQLYPREGLVPAGKGWCKLGIINSVQDSFYYSAKVGTTVTIKEAFNIGGNFLTTMEIPGDSGPECRLPNFQLITTVQQLADIYGDFATVR